MSLRSLSLDAEMRFRAYRPFAEKNKEFAAQGYGAKLHNECLEVIAPREN